jgi:hypothetical protein
MNQIDVMVNRFLFWKLPKNFAPDSFISFDGAKHDTWGGYPNSWPTGTNLFDAAQAREMLDHVAQPLLIQIETRNAEVEHLFALCETYKVFLAEANAEIAELCERKSLLQRIKAVFVQ